MIRYGLMRKAPLILCALGALVVATGCEATPVAGSPAPVNLLSSDEHRPGAAESTPFPDLLGRPDQQTVIAEVEKLLAGVDVVIMHPEIDGQFSLDEMIVHGLEQEPPKHITTDAGELIVWGWNEARPEDKSLLIFDANGALELVAFSHAIPSLRSMRGRIPRDAIEGHVARINDDATYVQPPFISLYVEDSRLLPRLYSISRLWVQAAVVGFNATCSQPEYEALCAVAEEFEPSIRIHSLGCLRARRDLDDCLIAVPARPAREGLSVDSFVQ